MTASVDVSTAPLPPKVPGMNFRERIDAMRNYHHGVRTIHEKGGGVVQVPLGPPPLVPRIVVVTSPQGVRDVLGGSDGKVDKGLPIHQETRNMGVSSFNMQHEEWKPRRRTLQPLFTKKHVKTFATHMAEEADAAVRRAVADREVELNPLTRRLTLQVLGRSVLGLDLGERARDIGPDIELILQYVTRRGMAPMRLPASLPTPATRRYRAARTRLYTLLDDAVAQCRRDPDHPAELIRLLVQAEDPETTQPLSDEDIRGELWTFIVAGHDTTATTLAYSLWALGRDQELQDRVAEEVRRLGDRPLTADDASALDLTVRVLHEALRLCPPAPVVGRLAKRDVLVDGYRVPSGTGIMLGIMSLHHDPELWDDPLRFDPDRFKPENSAGRNRWQYLPFGGGPRSCIGDHFAMLEATIGLATIVRSARVESLEDDFPLEVPFTMTAGGPIPARITGR